MYCPNCGKTNSSEQNFCRSCGLNLEKIAQSILEQLPAGELDKVIQDRRRRADRLIKFVAGSAISIVVASVLWGIIYEIIIVKGEVLAGSIFLSFILALILFALLVIYRESLLKASRRPFAEQEMPKATAKLLPESQAQSMASITERTTDLLMAEKKDETGKPSRP
jgi:hypothetical protein